MNVHEIIDEFVARVDPSGQKFQPVESAPWVETLETMLPKRFPVSFRSLITRYAFSPFVAGELSFFGNTGSDSPDELSQAIFIDRIISEVTLNAGYIHFARPEDGSYDPICFDARKPAGNREFPIVQLDHEAILCHNRIKVIKTVANSFYRFAGAI